MRIMLYGDGVWAANSLERLYDQQHSIVGVVVRSKPSDTAMEETARKLGIPLFQPRQVNAPDFIEKVKSIAPDLCLSISYNQILRRPLLETARLGFINFHAGKLPYYRGRNVINWAIINGETEIGLTAHLIDEGIDTGDILLQKTLPIYWTDGYGEVLNRVVAAFPEFVLEAVEAFASGKIIPKPQAHLPGTYFSGREDGDEWLDWSDTSFNLYNKVRAIKRPGPGARTLIGDRVAIIWRVAYDASLPKYIATPGQIVGRNVDGAIIKTGDSTLLIQEVQIEDGISEKPSWPIGTRLGINLTSLIRTLLGRIENLEKQLSWRGTSHGASSSH